MQIARVFYNRGTVARFVESSDQSLMIYFGNEISLAAHVSVVKLLRMLQANSIPGVLNLHPAYHSMLIKFDPLMRSHAELEVRLTEMLSHLDDVKLPEPRLVSIPVCYGGTFGPDLADVAALHSLSEDQVVEMHSASTYVVYFLGFVPGFAYLGGLDERLATPRLPSPRRQVPAGSVGIAANQTGVYPVATPGGWRLIGRTPLSIFQAGRADMSLLSIGDHVRFVPVPPEQCA